MRAAAFAGSLYFALVFTVAFAFGALRVTTLVPLLGELGGVALEVPVLLVVSWSACEWLTSSFRVPRTSVVRLAMGGLALALLGVAEVTLGTLLFGRGAAEQLAALRTLPGVIGLVGQVGFGLVPFIQLQWVLRR